MRVYLFFFSGAPEYNGLIAIMASFSTFQPLWSASLGSHTGKTGDLSYTAPRIIMPRNGAAAHRLPSGCTEALERCLAGCQREGKK